MGEPSSGPLLSARSRFIGKPEKRMLVPTSAVSALNSQKDINSQIGGMETELGRKLNEAEVEAVLKRWGNPMLVAERYQPHRQLIGPALFPEPNPYGDKSSPHF